MMIENVKRMIGGRELVMLTKHGSHLYGTSTPDSEVDYKGIFMPTLEDLLMQNCPKQFRTSTGKPDVKNEAGDIDIVVFSLPYFLELACKGETIALDMLHSDDPDHCLMYSTLAWEAITRQRSRFYTKNMTAFVGYAQKQAAKYGLKGTRMASLEELVNAIEPIEHYAEEDAHGQCRPYLLKDIVEMGVIPQNEHCRLIEVDGNKFYEVLGSKYQLTIRFSQFRDLINDKWNEYGARARAAKENQGIDWKAMHHAVRAAVQLISIYEKGTIKYPLVDHSILLNIKLGNVDFEQAIELLQDMMDKVKVLADQSDYPESVDKKYWDHWLLGLYKKTLLPKTNRYLKAA